MTDMAQLKVLKFGGTSMGSADAMKKVIAIIAEESASERIAAVVVSAMSGVTDALIAIARAAAAKEDASALIAELETRHVQAVEGLVSDEYRAEAVAMVRERIESLRRVAVSITDAGELSPESLDHAMSYGERLSAHILADALKSHGVDAGYLDAREVIRTNDAFGAAIVDFDTTDAAIVARVAAGSRLLVVTGFIGKTADGRTTTLGRGGSDYTASIVGAALSASVIEIWTDVSGVYTTDPRKVKEAFPLESLTYLEAIEMSYFGAKVIYPPTMYPAMEKKIPLLIKNTFAPKDQGTVISEKSAANSGFARGISSIGNVTMMQVSGSGMQSIPGAAGRLFGALGRAQINPYLITQASSENSISFAVAPVDAERAKTALEGEFAIEQNDGTIDNIASMQECSVIAVVGEGMRHRAGVAGTLFQTLGKTGISVIAIAQGSSELNISFVVARRDEARALHTIHTAIFFPHMKPVNIFLVGTGKIGSELLLQIAAQRKALLSEHGFVIRVVGIGDSEKMCFDEQGIDAAEWSSVLAEGEAMSLAGFIEHMRSLDVPAKIFVDCTASEDVAAAYANILSSLISVVTPNKRANSGPYAYFKQLAELAQRPGVSFLYETNACAALPIISMLDDLSVSGDSVEKIEGVLSGSLSYVWNTFDGSTPFSATVAEAEKLGYMESDAGEDLRGVDVARKVLILARKSGFDLELSDVRAESLLGDDASYQKLYEDASAKGERLRYIATLEDGHAVVALRSVAPSHPFYELSGSDNIVAITTSRYSVTPLVIKGPGAGAAVTAAGVFADILRAARDMA